MCAIVHPRQRCLLCVSGFGLVSCCDHVLTRLHRASSKQEILDSGVTVASLFFGKVFGSAAQKALTVFVALRYVQISSRSADSYHDL